MPRAVGLPCEPLTSRPGTWTWGGVNEQLTKARGVPVLASESTRVHVGAALGFAPVGVVEVRGRSQPLAVYMPTCGSEGQ